MQYLQRRHVQARDTGKWRVRAGGHLRAARKGGLAAPPPGPQPQPLSAPVPGPSLRDSRLPRLPLTGPPTYFQT